jgi:hypothetical protein
VILGLDVGDGGPPVGFVEGGADRFPLGRAGNENEGLPGAIEHW